MFRAILRAARGWTRIGLRQHIVSKRLAGMTPEDAAAYFILHRHEDMTEAEQKLFITWFSSDDAKARALSRAEAAWKCFDRAGDDEVLAALRVKAREPTPRG
jgi:ferric-dicitrate binding protein FerR (iron transport regulator)